MLIKIILIFKIFCISIFILSFVQFIKNENNWIKDIFDRYKKLTNKKKIEFIFLITFISPFFIFILSIEFIYSIYLILWILINYLLKKKKIIKVKNKKWIIENFCFGPFKISDLIIKIIENQIINTHNTCFFRIYKIMSKNEKNYKEIISKIGFKLFSGISYRFINNILTFCEKRVDIKINKIFYLLILIFIRNCLIALLQTINSDYRYICIIQNRIIIENYKIYINGKLSLILIDEFAKNKQHNVKFGGYYFNKLYGNEKKGHVFMIDGFGNIYGLTSSGYINCYSNGILKTFFIGLQSNGRNQNAVFIVKGEGYNEMYQEYPYLTPQLIKDFNLENIMVYIGKEASYSFFLKNLLITQGILRGRNQEIINIKKDKILNEREDILKETIKLDHEELGKKILSSLNSIERSEIEIRHQKFLEDSNKII